MPTKSAVEVMPATRMANVRYAIRDLAVLADEVARAGNKILYLNIGDPCKYDFRTPPHMIEAVTKAMHDGQNGYADSLGIKPAIEPFIARPSATASATFRASSSARQRRSDRRLPDRAAQSRRQRADAEPGVPVIRRGDRQAGDARQFLPARRAE